MLTNVTFMNRGDAAKVNPSDEAAMISIYTPGDEPAKLQPGWKNLLSISFYDSDREIDQASPGFFYPAITEKQAELIYAFVVSHHHCNFLYIHCDAGISRSAAVALFVAERYDLYFPIYHTMFNSLVYSKLRKVQYNDENTIV